MVKPFISLLFLLIFSAKAVPITLILADEVPMSDGKICVYENAQRSESVKVATAASCHHTKTFETDD